MLSYQDIISEPASRRQLAFCNGLRTCSTDGIAYKVKGQRDVWYLAFARDRRCRKCGHPVVYSSSFRAAFPIETEDPRGRTFRRCREA